MKVLFDHGTPAALRRHIKEHTVDRSAENEHRSPFGVIVALSGKHEFGGGKVTEATLNGFPSRDESWGE